MTLDISQVAEQVKVTLNAGSYSQSVTGDRRWLPEYNISELGTLTVTVVPNAESVESIGRTNVRDEYTIDIGIQKLLGTHKPGDTAYISEIDGLVKVAKEIADRFRVSPNHTLNTTPKARWIRTEIPAPYSPDDLKEHGVFMTVVRLTFKSLDE